MNAQTKIEFGTDGIRGVAGCYPLDPTTVLRIGRAIGRWLCQGKSHTPRVLIGRDPRISGSMLAHTLSAGLLAEGVEISDIQVMSTPGIAYLVPHYSYDLGIVISASHNPVEQNGIKLFGPDGYKLDDASEEHIEHLIATLDGQTATERFGRFLRYPDMLSPYETDLIEACIFGPLEGLRVVLDCANGAASQLGLGAFKRAGCSESLALNHQPDGWNINVNAGSEHVRRDRSALLSAVRDHSADLGVAFDGDADRVVFVTPEGMLIDGDHTLGILALELKARGQLAGNTVVATDMSNSGLEHFLQQHGIALSRTKVGDRYVMERMREKGFTLGGEQAGHVIILDGKRTAGDGIFAGLMMASLAAHNKRQGGPTLHELAARIPRYPQVIASAHLHSKIDLATVSGLDALKAEILAQFEGKGRVNIRFSGTEPNLLRGMVEGGPQTTLPQVIEHALALCRLVGQAAHTPNPVIDVVDCVTGAPVTLS